MRKIVLLLIFLGFTSYLWAGTTFNFDTGKLDFVPTVEEEDGNPSVDAPLKIKVTNSSLTDNGDGSVSISTSGGGESTTVSDTTTINLTLTGADITADGLYTAGDDLTLTGADFDVDSTVTRDTEWDTLAEINTASTDADILIFQNLAVSGQTTVVTDGVADTLTLVGAGITVITTDATTDTITFTSTEVDGSTSNELPTAGTYIDVTGQQVDVDLTEAESVTWGAGAAATIVHTYNVSGTDTTMTMGSALITFSGDITVTGGDITLGTSAIFSGGDTTSLNLIDAIDATTEATLETAIDIAGDVTGTGLGSTVVGNDSHDHSAAGSTVTINAADIIDLNAGTAITADLEEEVTEGSLANSTIVSADIKNGTIVVADTAITAGRSLTWSTNDMSSDAETYIYVAKIAFENPVAGDDFFFDELTSAVTFTKIYAKTLVGTVDFDITIAGVDINGTDITATTAGVLDESFAGDTTGAVDEEVKLEITSVASAPTYIMIILTGTYDD